MKFLHIAVIAFVFSLVAQKSDAFIYGSDEKMFFHSETMWQDDGGNNLSLCVLRKRYHVMWVAIWSNYEYAVADNRCDTDSLFEYSAEMILADIESGEMTAIDGPDVPLTLGRIFWGFTWLILLIPVVLFGIWAIRAQNNRSARRAELTSHIPEKVHGPLAFCLQAALSDGTADDNELAAISNALKEVYSQCLTVQQLRELVDNTEMNAEAPEIKNFLMLGTNEEKHQALRLLVMVTAADGNLDQAELKFAVEMGAKLGFTQADVAQVYQGMRGKADTQV